MSSSKTSPVGGLVDRIRAWNRLRVLRRRLARPVSETVFGFRMNGLEDMRTGRFEPEETALVRTLLNNADRFVNVGANLGYYCCFAQQAGVPTVALEPVPSNVRIIAQNMAANGWSSDITVLPVAAGKEPGFLEVYGVGTGASLVKGWAGNPENLKQTVSVVRLDDVITRQASGERLVVLMDIEGFEYFALQGAPDLIATDPKPAWLIEVVSGYGESYENPHAEQVFELMTAAGYAIYRAEQNLAPVAAPGGGVTNFLFVDRDKPLDAILGEAASRVNPYAP